MSESYRFAMDQKDIVRLLVTTVGSFIRDQLISKEKRAQHKEQCAERLAAEDGSYDREMEVRYADQAVLANLDWGIEALEEAIDTSNIETKYARLDYAEKMLNVCAMLNSNQKTAGVPNFYLSAWSHLNLSYLCKLRNNVQSSVLHVLEMFTVDPFFSRIDFAPQLWKELFLPQMSSIVGWYFEERHRLMMEVIPDSTDLSFTADLDQYFNESLIFTMRPDQTEKLHKLEQQYRESLDENTRMFAKYYKDCMKSDSTTSKKVIAMLPIAEPPMTPLNEVSRAIPDYVKFGPILPKSAGFSPVLKSKPGTRDTSRKNFANISLQNQDEHALWDPQEGILEEDEEECENEPCEDYMSEMTIQEVESPNLMKKIGDHKTAREVKPIIMKNQIDSPTVFSPIISPNFQSPKNLSPKPDLHGKKEHTSLIRLLSNRITDSTILTSLPVSPHLSNDYNMSSDCSVESDGEITEMQHSARKSYGLRSMSYKNVNMQEVQNSPSLVESDEGKQSCISLTSSEKATSRTRPPKDFVCPITGQIFMDPVTLETGQTYERKAIQEWLKRGNTTCPITRQPLSASVLPKTNYVLKRLITSWKEQNPHLVQEFSYCETPWNSFNSPSPKETQLQSPPTKTSNFYSHNSRDENINQRTKRFIQTAVSTSPTSVLSQAAVDTIINGLRPFVSCLCTSENLQECEAAVLAIARSWKDSKGDPAIRSYLSKPTNINGFMEILSASLSRKVLRTAIYILSELLFADESVLHILTSVESDFDCLAALLKNGLAEAAVLIYQLRPAFSQLSSQDFIPSLVQLIQNKTEELDDLQFMMEPIDAALELLEQILMRGDDNSRYLNVLSIISGNGIPALIKSLAKVEGRRSIVSILSCCMHADKSCRFQIANRVELSLVLELFHAGNDSLKGICIEFLSQIVQLNRRILCNNMLKTIKHEGVISTMHSFLVYLQMAPMEKQPTIATLLLQLDLMAEPRKMSIYREEAIDTLIEALNRKEFFNCQMMALDALLSLSGRVASSGMSYTEVWLLKIAGLDQPYNALMKAERLKDNEDDVIEISDEEEKSLCSWEKRVAFVLCNHEKGSIFIALKDCLKSNSLEMAKSSLVISTWLIYMLSTLPNTGVKDAARKYLLDEFINVLQSSRNTEEKILATLALKTFISDPAAIEELGKYAKCIYKTLRKLRRNSSVVTDMKKALMNLSSVDSTELWNCTETVESDCSTNGEVVFMVHQKGRILSSHSDGTIKMWDTGKKPLRLIQEVREHTKAVTSLCIPYPGDKLYTGSLDKTIRVWALKPEEISCVQVHDMKEPVHGLTADSKLACFMSQGTGVKVYHWSGVPKHINFNKNVKCLTMSGNKLYCACSGYSIQEVDLCNFTSATFYSGTRKLLGKQSIQSLYIDDGLLIAGGSSVDGSAGKVFSLSTKAASSSFMTGLDIQHISVNNDFIFTANKCGIIEVWLKEKMTRIASIKMGSNNGAHLAKITSLASDLDGEMLYAASSDGKIQAWSLD